MLPAPFETTRRNWNFSCKLVFVFDYPYIFTGQIHIGNSSYRRPNTFLLWLHPTEAACFFMFSLEQCHFPQSHSLSSSLPFCEFSILFPLQVSIQEPKNREGRYATLPSYREREKLKQMLEIQETWCSQVCKLMGKGDKQYFCHGEVVKFSCR